MPPEVPKMLPGWRRAYKAVWLLFPSSRAHTTSEHLCITPGPVLHRAELSAAKVQQGKIAPWEEHREGPSLYAKVELLNYAFAGVRVFVGEVVLITDDCFPMTEREPYFGRGENLRESVEPAPLAFEGDTVFISPQDRRISVFHHEGIFAHIDCGEQKP